MIFNKNLIRLGLTIFGCVGVPLTSWLSVKCHEKAKDEETREGKFKRYIPAAISGVATIASIAGSHHISSKEIALLTTTASFAVANRDKLEEAVKPYVKKEEVKQLVPKYSRQTIENTGNGPLRCLEAYSGRMFYSSIEAVQKAESKLSIHFSDGEAVSMNDFYSYLGISKTAFGDQWGWIPDENIYPRWYEDNPIGFENSIEEDEDGNPLLVITIMSYPIEGWLEEAKYGCLPVR